MSGRLPGAWVVAALLASLVATGCTIRYSQTLVGEIRSVRGSPLQKTETGAEFGILGPLSLVTISEPQSAVELLSTDCDVALAEADYRGKWAGWPMLYVLFPTASFPTARVTSYCVSP